MNLRYIIAAILSTLIIICVSSIPQQSFTGSGTLHEQIISNLLHIPAFAILTFFWLKSFKKEKTKKSFFIFNSVILAGVFLFAISDEIHQSFVPGRTASLMDLGLNALGIICGVSVFLALMRLNSKIIQPTKNTKFAKSEE